MPSYKEEGRDAEVGKTMLILDKPYSPVVSSGALR
jgi:hypothetical protein